MENECRHEYEIKLGMKPWIFAKCKKCDFRRPLRQNYSFMISVISLFGLVPYIYLKDLNLGSTTVYLATIALYLAFGALEILVFMLYLKSLRPSQLDRYFDERPME